jgi:hypothetical protein
LAAIPGASCDLVVLGNSMCVKEKNGVAGGRIVIDLDTAVAFLM